MTTYAQYLAQAESDIASGKRKQAPMIEYVWTATRQKNLIAVHEPTRTKDDDMHTEQAIDFDARYTVDGHRGIAFYLLGFVERDTPDTEWDGIREVDTSQVRAVMVGDDHEHIIDVDDLTAISEDDYCHSCGQIGCGWGH